MADDEDTVEWRLVHDAPDYEVSSDGRVRSLRRNRKHGCELRPWKEKREGRFVIDLKTLGGFRITRFVHSLVLEAFVGPRPNGFVSRHLDGNVENNVSSNLVWGTQSENVFDTVRHGNHNQARKTHCKRGHLFDEDNTYLPPKGGRNCRQCYREVHRKRRVSN